MRGIVAIAIALSAFCAIAIDLPHARATGLDTCMRRCGYAYNHCRSSHPSALRGICRRNLRSCNLHCYAAQPLRR
jgi:hypothetical protein